MKIRENTKIIFLIIGIIVGWYILFFSYTYITEIFLNFIDTKFKLFLVIVATLCLIYTINLIIKRDFKGLKEVFKILIIIVIFIGLFFLWNSIRYQKIELPDGSIVVLDRIFHNNSIRIGNYDYIFDSGGNCMVRDTKTKETIRYLNNYELPQYIKYIKLKIEYAGNHY